MAIKCKFVASILFFVLLSISLAGARTLRTVKFEEMRRRIRALFQNELSSSDSLVCAYCDPPQQCNGIVAWCPPR